MSLRFRSSTKVLDKIRLLPDCLNEIFGISFIIQILKIQTAKNRGDINEYKVNSYTRSDIHYFLELY